MCGVYMRTTSSLEKYNQTLGSIVVSRAQFFRFVLALRAEEYKTSTVLEKFIKSGGLRQNCAQKKQYKENNKTPNDPQLQCCC